MKKFFIRIELLMKVQCPVDEIFILARKNVYITCINVDLKRFHPIKKGKLLKSNKQRRLFLPFLKPNFFSEINMLRIWTSRLVGGG
jgi:hypothetical protein